MVAVLAKYADFLSCSATFNVNNAGQSGILSFFSFLILLRYSLAVINSGRH